MGRSSRVGDWLEGAGWQRPAMRRMAVKVNYATAYFKRDERISDVLMVGSSYDDIPERGQRAHGAGVVAVEGDRWLMIQSTFTDDRLGRDPEEFVARTKDYPAPLSAIGGQAQMIGEVNTYHQADSRRRDYDEVERMPAGLVVAGDAVASFNPIYGQGMTCATLHASALSAYLRSDADLDRPARAYFERVRVVVDAAWGLSTFNDLALPHVDGPYPRGYPILKRLGGAMFKAAAVDGVVAARLAKVTTMVRHPSSLVAWSVVWRVLRVALFRR
jgi:2-polyprenyl-6-methoxyphenol hydroxylase-like FAD-dependent oxidoreductase